MLSLIAFAGCSSKPLRVDLKPLDIPRPPDHVQLPMPEPVHLLPYQFQLLTPKRLPSGDFVIVGLTVDDYENLMKSQAELLRWVSEAQFRCTQP